jgi:hypothetical protein
MLIREAEYTFRPGCMAFYLILALTDLSIVLTRREASDLDTMFMNIIQWLMTGIGLRLAMIF